MAYALKSAYGLINPPKIYIYINECYTHLMCYLKLFYLNHLLFSWDWDFGGGIKTSTCSFDFDPAV